MTMSPLMLCKTLRVLSALIEQANRALYIIWCDEWQGDRYSLAAGHLSAMLAAWDAMADYSPRDTLSLQFGSRILRTRLPE